MVGWLPDLDACLPACAGRFGSRVLAQELRPDVLIAVDVNHDYDTAPTMGAGEHTRTAVLCLLKITNLLPRQARDNHEQNSNKEIVSAGKERFQPLKLGDGMTLCVVRNI